MKDREGANSEQGWYRTPNYYVDRVLAKITSSEWAIIHVVLRETLGWKSDSDPNARRDWAEISLDQFEEKTGLARTTLVEAINISIERGLLQRRTVQRGRRRTFCYRVVERANLKEVPARPDRRQSQLPFNVTEFEIPTPSNADEVANSYYVTEFEIPTPSPLVLIVDQRKDDDRSDRLTEFEIPTPSRPGAFPHLDPPPLVFYSDITGNRIGPNDLRYYKTVAHHPEWLIKCGVALGFLRHELAESTAAPIRSFKFFLNPIAEVKERGVDATYLEYALRVITRIRPREAKVMAIAVGQALADNRSDLLRTADYYEPPKYERPATQTVAPEVPVVEAGEEAISTTNDLAQSAILFTLRGASAFDTFGALMQAIEERLRGQAFRTWFKPLQGRTIDGVVEVSGPNSVVSKWIRTHYRDVVDEAARESGAQIEWSESE